MYGRQGKGIYQSDDAVLDENGEVVRGDGKTLIAEWIANRGKQPTKVVFDYDYYSYGFEVTGSLRLLDAVHEQEEQVYDDNDEPVLDDAGNRVKNVIQFPIYLVTSKDGLSKAYFPLNEVNQVNLITEEIHVH